MLTRRNFLRSSAATAAAVAVSSLAPTAFAAGNPVSEDATLESLRDQLRTAYFESEEFQQHYAADPEDAMEMLDGIIERQISGYPVAAAYDETYSVSTTLVQQLNSYSCGPASGYIAISGWNGTGSISGTTTTGKLQTLANSMGTTTDGTFVYRVRNTLNSYVSTYPYSYYLGSSMTQTDFCNYLVRSLGCSRAPILHARTQGLSYYNGHSLGHYITITQFNGTTMNVRLNDPNSSNTYYGTHTVSVAEAFAAIHNYSDRYLIAY